MEIAGVGLLIAGLVLAVLVSHHLICISNIKKHSKLCLKITEVNNKHEPLFYVLQRQYPIRFVCKNLQKYKNNNNQNSAANYSADLVQADEPTWRDLRSKAESNQNNLQSYLREYKITKDQLAGKSYTLVKRKTLLSEKRYRKHEHKICENQLLKPVTDIQIACKISYTSPKGQNHYAAEWAINVDEVFARIDAKKERERSIEHQRSLMTASKRYDILKRDGFQCKLCGRTADEGAKLEVDHITPVSKGGKTTENNLQTLCRECNRGKSAKL